jgi:uncharacterized protein YeaO (DUF488 family)
MPIRTRRWNDPAKKGDGVRILVCRNRPRTVSKDGEPWDVWWADLGPSLDLHASFPGKAGAGISWEQYRERYLEEMKAQAEDIQFLAAKVAEGGTVTLLCAASCTRACRCHRSLLKGLIEQEASALLGARAGTAPPAEAAV